MFERRDFEDQMSEFYNFDEPAFQANEDFMVIAGDSGRSYRSGQEIRRRTPATTRESINYQYQQGLQRELRALEMRLTTHEYEEFDANRSKIGGISEQIYFLRLPARERENYLALKGISRSEPVARGKTPRISPRQSNFQSLREGDVVLGMSKDEVLRNWGVPDRRDIAGSRTQQDERWAFRRGNVTKYIYFESGKVQGWSEQ